MDLLKDWVLRIIIASLLSGIICLLTPAGSIEKSVRTAVSLFMLFCIVYPFFDVSELTDLIKFNDLYVPYSEESDNDELFIKQLEFELREKINRCLVENGITVNSIEFDVIKNSDEILLKKILVKVLQNSHWTESEIKDLILSKTGFTVQIEVEDG